MQKKSVSNEAEEQDIAVIANNKKSVQDPPTPVGSTLPLLPEMPMPPEAKQATASKESKDSLVDAVPFDSKTGLPALPADPPVPPIIAPNEELPKPAKAPTDDLVLQELKNQLQRSQSDLPALPPSIPDPVAEPKKPSPPSVPAPTTELNAKAPQSPWHLNVEMVGQRTRLVAQLKQKAGEVSLARFEILCDRLEMKAPDGAMQALGNITFSGAGLKGKCNRLTLPLGETRVVFEDTVELMHAVKTTAFFWVPLKAGGCELEHNVPPGSVLRAEKIIWDLPPTKSPDVLPASFGVPGTTLPPVLGSPK